MKRQSADAVREGLEALFPAQAVKFKPQAVKGNRAQAIAYLDARVIMRRLDDVLGIDGWHDQYEVLPNGSVICGLTVMFVDDSGEYRAVTKYDIGSQSKQPSDGDKFKAAFSDAFKRCAVKWGIGRYLYKLPMQWVDYDEQKRRFARDPQLPAWATPKKAALTGPTGTSPPAQKDCPACPVPAAPGWKGGSTAAPEVPADATRWEHPADAPSVEKVMAAFEGRPVTGEERAKTVAGEALIDDAMMEVLDKLLVLCKWDMPKFNESIQKRFGKTEIQTLTMKEAEAVKRGLEKLANEAGKTA
jgi:hypothetical protein